MQPVLNVSVRSSDGSMVAAELYTKLQCRPRFVSFEEHVYRIIRMSPFYRQIVRGVRSIQSSWIVHNLATSVFIDRYVFGSYKTFHFCCIEYNFKFNSILLYKYLDILL